MYKVMAGKKIYASMTKTGKKMAQSLKYWWEEWVMPQIQAESFLNEKGPAGEMNDATWAQKDLE